MYIQWMLQNIKDVIYKWIQLMLIYVLFPQWRCLPADRQRRKLWHLRSDPASACVNLAVHLIVTSLELFALATAYGVGFNLNVSLLKCLQKVRPALWCFTGNKAIACIEASLSHAWQCTYRPQKWPCLSKEIVNFWNRTEGGVNNSCVNQPAAKCFLSIKE